MRRLTPDSFLTDRFDRQRRWWRQRAGRVSFRRAVRGQTMVLFALFIFVLVGFMALAIDGGYLMAERRQSQAAADAAALAAARAMLNGASDESVIAQGQHYGSINVDTPTGMVVIDPNPAGYGPDYVRATVTKEVQRFFIGAVYSGDWQVTTTAVAGIEPEQLPLALLVLQNPLDLRGTVSLVINGGSVHVNDEVTRSGASNSVQIDGTLSATGDIESLGTWQVGSIRPNSGFDVPDPLAGTPPPPLGVTRTNADLVAAGFSATGPRWKCDAVCTLPPGYYHHNNINPKIIEAKGTIILESGIFTFAGDMQLSANDANSHIIGDGVLLYFDGPANRDKLTPGNGNFHITAPCQSDPSTPSIPTCSGEAAYPGGAPGMALWITNCSTLDADGNGNYVIEGVIYAPCSLVQLDGTPGTNGMQVIVGELQLRGNGTFEISYRDYVTAEVPRIFLVE